MLNPKISDFVNKIYSENPIILNSFYNIQKTKDIKTDGNLIFFENIAFSKNSDATTITLSTVKSDNIDNNALLDIYYYYKSYLINKYKTENVIVIANVLEHPEYYVLNNEYKIFLISRNSNIDCNEQEYLEIIFNLIMNNNFSIVNLYRITDGNLNIFDKLWIENLILFLTQCIAN